MEEEAVNPRGSEETMLERLFNYYGSTEGERKGELQLSIEASYSLQIPVKTPENQSYTPIGLSIHKSRLSQHLLASLGFIQTHHTQSIYPLSDVLIIMRVVGALAPIPAVFGLEARYTLNWLQNITLTCRFHPGNDMSRSNRLHSHCKA